MQRLAARYPSDAPPVMGIVQHMQTYNNEQGTHNCRPASFLVLHGGGSDDRSDAAGTAGSDIISARISAAIAASKSEVAAFGGSDDRCWSFPHRPVPAILSVFVLNVSLRGVDVYGGLPVQMMANPPFNITEPPDFEGQVAFCVRVPSYASPAEYHLAVALLQCVVEELRAVTPGGCGRIPIKMVRRVY
jgi:hypothetical protein